jgi:hypothetical protein
LNCTLNKFLKMFPNNCNEHYKLLEENLILITPPRITHEINEGRKLYNVPEAFYKSISAENQYYCRLLI